MSQASVVIEYCPGCKWLLRSSWMLQELLSTFENEIEIASLKPSPTPGTFIISVGDKQIWNRKTDGGFPQVKELKQRVRDVIAPEKNLGHSEA